MHDAEWYRRMRAAHRCVCCGSPAAEGRCKCQPCGDRDTISQREHREALHRAKLCRACKREVEPVHMPRGQVQPWYCPECAARNASNRSPKR